jgi:nucleoside-diphosphate-sugar epimerase
LSSKGVVLVTGGSGSIGLRLLQRLGRDGWRRRCLVHHRPVLDAEEVITGDLTDVSSLRHAVDGVASIIHLGALTHSRSLGRYEQINLRGTRNLLDAARDADVRRFLLVSTRAIAREGGAYSRSKYESEEAVRRSGLEWTIVRLPEVYGAGSVEGIDRIIALARYGRWIPLVGSGDDLVCPVHVDDAVSACIRALEVPAAVKKTYTLAGPCLTVREFANVAREVFRRSPRIVPVPTPAVAVLAASSRVLPLPLYPDQLTRLRSPKPPASPDAEADLLFSPRPLRDGLGQVGEVRAQD